MVQLLSLLGRLQLQLGNVHAADDAFGRLECLIPVPEEVTHVRTNRGLHAMAVLQYPLALVEFQAALALEPGSVLAANNAAVCQLYCSQLDGSVSTLEGALHTDPHASMHPALIANLVNLYQMTCNGPSTSAKSTLERLVASTADQDFDMSLLNLGQ